MNFKLTSKFKPSGDQPKAIDALVKGLEKGYEHQTLLGVTGSGKTFTVANVIERVQKPTLVIAHNKTLAAQLCNEFRELFPENAVHYFVSYYDYYQPEAYLPTTDTYIEKEAMINEEIDKLRHAATAALLTRKDVIVVASVSCIYGLGDPETYKENIFHFKVGDTIDRSYFVRKLIELQFTRTNGDLRRATFRLRGDNWEIMPPDREIIYNFELEEDPKNPGGPKIIKAIYEVSPVEGLRPGKTPTVPEVYIAPAKHFITPPDDRDRAIYAIKEELKERLKYFEKQGKLLEIERLERRTKFDIAMIREVGYCHGIENYSRHLSGRKPGEPPATLLDYFSLNPTNSKNPANYKTGNIISPWRNNVSSKDKHGDFLMVIDESHVTVPQLRGMYEGDASRKKTLVEYGFRLPSAVDNRPLKFEEFEKRMTQVIYTSATPGPYEKNHSDPSINSGQGQIVEQIIRPTGLVDPKIVIKPVRGQIDDLIPRIEERVKNKERVLVTTLTKRMAEDLTEYLTEMRTTFSSQKSAPVEGLSIGKPSTNANNEKSKITAPKLKPKVAYLHSDVKTLDRIRILTNLRRGNFDVLVGVNLLREGLDLPEVSLIGILDADKEGFLRSETSLIQTIGRAARNVAGQVVIYADHITGSIRRAVDETNRRREIQTAYNRKHGITPKSIVKAIKDILPEYDEKGKLAEGILKFELRPLPKSKTALEELIKEKEKDMKAAAQKLDFELAAILRDEIRALSKKRRVVSS